MRPKGSAIELEHRRRLAVARLHAGERPEVVARALGVSVTTIFRWRARAGQPEGLAARPHQGPRRRLNSADLAELKALLAAPPFASGWSVRRIKALILRRFGVAYHPEHVRKLLKEFVGTTAPPREATRAG